MTKAVESAKPAPLKNANQETPTNGIRVERTFWRFSISQRWEHAVLLVTFASLLLTGIPQKYRAAAWSQQLLSSPERVTTLRQIHHIAALLLATLVLYHLGRAITLMVKRKLPGDMLPTWQDIKDAWQMLKYLVFLTDKTPKFGKYNFEQKFTYWVLFFGIGIMGVSGFIIWFPVFFTNFMPGGVVPAAKLAHSTEAVVAGIFVVIWHFYHVHLQRLNLSIFTGRITEHEMRTYHTAEYERLTDELATLLKEGDSQ